MVIPQLITAFRCSGLIACSRRLIARRWLSQIAEGDAADVDAAVDGLSSLLEPLIMVILGVLVGGLVVAMYLPIFKLGQVV